MLQAPTSIRVRVLLALGALTLFTVACSSESQSRNGEPVPDPSDPCPGQVECHGECVDPGETCTPIQPPACTEPDCVETLAVFDDWIGGVAVDETDVYVMTGTIMDDDADASRLWRIAKSGGPPTLVAERSGELAGGLSVAPDRTFAISLRFSGDMLTDDEIWSMPKAGGVRSSIAIDKHIYGVTHDATNVYWASMTSVMKSSHDGGAVGALGPTTGMVEALAVGASHVYYVGSDHQEPGTLWRVPISGGPRELFYQGERLSQLAVAAGLVYTLEWTSGINTPPERLVTIDEATRATHAVPLTSGISFMDDMIADANGMYWSTAFETIAIDPESGAELWRVDRGGSEQALDPEHLYIGDRFELLRTPRAR